jgi:glycosyltransferase involved in cell wall biosynthesis
MSPIVPSRVAPKPEHEHSNQQLVPAISDLADRDDIIKALGGDLAVLLMVPVWESELGGNRLQVARVLSKHMPVILMQPAELDLATDATLQPDVRIANCWVLRTRYASGPLDGDLEEVASHLADIRWAVAQFGARRPIYWLFNPNLSALFQELDNGPRLFHATEDWYRFPRPLGTSLDLKELAAAVRAADLVVAVSHGVAAELRRNVADVEPVIETNGCNYAVFDAATPDPTLLREVRLRCDRLAVFCGTIDGRLRYDLLVRLLESRPSFGLVMIGPIVHIEEEDREALGKLRSHARVVFLGPLEESSVAAVYKASDVGLIAYKTLPHIVASQFSSKLLEMAAAGLPVVITQMESSKGLADAIHVCDSDMEFVAIASSLHRGTLSQREQAELSAVARANDYTTKFTRLLEKLATSPSKCVGSPRLSLELCIEVQRLAHAKRMVAQCLTAEARVVLLRTTLQLRRLLGRKHVTVRKALGTLGLSLKEMGRHAAAIRFMGAALQPRLSLTPSYRDWRVSMCLALASSFRAMHQSAPRINALREAWVDSVYPTFHAVYSQNIGIEYAAALLETADFPTAHAIISEIDQRDHGLERDHSVSVRLGLLRRRLANAA